MYKSAATYNATKNFDEEVSVDMDLNEAELASPIIIVDPKVRVLALYNRIQMLKEVSSKFLGEIKQCKTSFQNANEVVGELNGNSKKFK